jgi:RHS repeat-associated protein
MAPGQRKEADNREASTDKSSSALPSISLPKGGGAIRGIGEKFTANPVTGTGSIVVPIFTTPGRSGFFPQLSLSYDSGAGSGPFGLGWSLSVPSISRKTEKGLPRYLDSGDSDSEDSDTFILSGTEDLVPSLKRNGAGWVRDILDGTLDSQYIVQRYRPRIEGLFARIERWQHKKTGNIHWRSITKDNVSSIYGRSASSKIADSDDPLRIFKWLLEESADDKGNRILYEYKQENSDNVSRSLPHEKNRLANGNAYANQYLKRIRYANRTPTPSSPKDWLLEVVFDYGEHDTEEPLIDEARTWPCRQDPFSSFRAGFEIRTYRLCRRVLMFHRFAELGSTPCLVRSTDVDYAESPVASFLTSVSQTGYVRNSETGSYLKRSLPPVEFAYTEPAIDEEIHFIDSESLENLPTGLDGSRYQWIDLDSEGISGILMEQAKGWFFKRNLGAARLGPLELVAKNPSTVNLNGGRQHVMDLAGDGHPYLVQFEGPSPGSYKRTHDADWEPFAPFSFSPNIDWNDPNLRFIDLSGDGHPDILITEDEVFVWYASLAREGFAPSEATHKAPDEEKGPALVFADSNQSVYLADMTGDGLTDIVRIRNGEVCYWPNAGYGHFAAKVIMAQPPWFDHADSFNQQRVRLADIDGSGTTDIIYLGRDTITFWINQAGNSWSTPQNLTQFPPTDNLTSVMVVDLLGNGTACIVWSSPLPGHAAQRMRYIDLMGGQKPNLLKSIKNNLGAETRLSYTASTTFYLADKAAGKPWVTKLPFPVHVVEQVEVRDWVTNSKFVTRYAYHHGYYDGEEREFRGFGLVEQWDTEEFAPFTGSGLFPGRASTLEKELHVPPVHTKTWFHTGAYLTVEKISRHYQQEYYQGDHQATLLPDTLLPASLSAKEEQQACRALKGAMLRQEIYGEDGSAKSEHPYSVTDNSYEISRVQPVEDSQYAVFFVHPREAISYYYERNPADPRVAHQITLEVDEFGNTIKSAAIGYPRRPPPAPLSHPKEQQQLLITYTETQVINKPNEASWYRIGVPIETRTYELTGLPRPDAGALFPFDLLSTKAGSAAEIQYDDKPNHTSPQKRLIEHVRALYLKNDLSGSLPFGDIESLALPYESYKMAFTPGLLDVFSSKISKAKLATLLKSKEGRYRDLDADGALWIPSGRIFFSPVPKPAPSPIKQDVTFAREHFFLPQATQDPFGNISRVKYDLYNLLLTDAEDTLGNTVSSRSDYRVLAPAQMTDPNGNRSQVVFDALGMVVGTAVMGKEKEPDGKAKGDSLEGFEPNLDNAVITEHIELPLADPRAILKTATTRVVYDLSRYHRSKRVSATGEERGEPVVVYTLARETHNADLKSGELTGVQHGFLYADGFGREVQKKIQAEPGLAPLRGPDGLLQVDKQVETLPRWVGAGRTVYDNKGNPVKQYEPFFSTTHLYEDEPDLIESGVTPILHYDPLGRLIRTDFPNGTFSKVEFDPWQQTTWDVNDTVLESRWHAERQKPGADTSERRADDLAAKHFGTPSIAHLDSLGRTFLTIADNGPTDKQETRVELDIESNQRSITDALGRRVMTYDYDMLSSKIHQVSMDAGEGWMLNDVTGKPIRTWDSRSHTIRMKYDKLHRPTHLFVREGVGAEILAERVVYGEAHSDSLKSKPKLNLRGRVYQLYDGAGVVTTEGYDFKGNAFAGNRRLAREYKTLVDWSAIATLTNVKAIEATAASLLETEVFTTSTAFDALNRPITVTAPDKSVIRPTYNVANLLERVNVNLRGAATATPFVTDIDYDAKGQREQIVYGNGVRTKYTYDRLTFRLIHLDTTRESDGKRLQDLSYTYDPVGNITTIRDDAQQTIYFKNRRVEPSADYTYDALYRLVSATGREHLGQNTDGKPNAPRQPNDDDSFRVNLPHPGDGNAMGAYVESYEYDAVGNILKMIHRGTDPAHAGWTRGYTYHPENNRLQSTSLAGDPAAGPFSAKYEYDAHGNMVKMPHLPLMQWDFMDQLHKTAKQVRTDGGTPEITYYVYNARGQRMRKVTERAAAVGGTPTRKAERIYMGGFEVHREYAGNGSTITLERETLHIADDQQRAALVETRTQGSDGSPSRLIRYQFSNHLNSASLELDSEGTLISYEEYYPYGSTSYRAVRSDVEVSPKRYRYTGMERDEESGLYYHGARYYAPWLGRWMSCDPEGLVDGTNIYAYSRNNPVRFNDLSGTQSTDDSCKPYWVLGGKPFLEDPCPAGSSGLPRPPLPGGGAYPSKAGSQPPSKASPHPPSKAAPLKPPTPAPPPLPAPDTPSSASSEARGPKPGSTAAARLADDIGGALADKATEFWNETIENWKEDWYINWNPALRYSISLTKMVFDVGDTARKQGLEPTINKYNPLFYAFLSVYKGGVALDAGDRRAAIKEWFTATQKATETVMLAEGLSGPATRFIKSEAFKAFLADTRGSISIGGRLTLRDAPGMGRVEVNIPSERVYKQRRTLANTTNAAIRKLFGLIGTYTEINEKIPVRFGGSPTDWSNKELLTPPEHWAHSKQWRQLWRDLTSP